MKWVKLNSNFFETQTAAILEESLGPNGPLAYIKIITSIGRDINSAEEVRYFHEQGWTKSAKNWRKITGLSPLKFDRFLQISAEMFKISVKKIGIFITLNFKNSTEFVDLRALSSKSRKTSGYPDGSQKGPLDIEIDADPEDFQYGTPRPLTKNEKKEFVLEQDRLRKELELKDLNSKRGAAGPLVKAKLSPSPEKKQIIALYCEEFKNRYQVSAIIRGKEAGQLSQLVKDLGSPKVGELLKAYFQMNTPWFLTKRHDISTLLQNLNDITIFAETGKTFDAKNSAQLREASNLDVMKRYLEGPGNV